MSEAILMKRAALKVKNIQPPGPDPQKLAPEARVKTSVTTVSAKRKDLAASDSNVTAESTNNLPKRTKGAKTLSLSRKSKKVQPDGKKQLSMDNFVIKSPRASLSPNYKTDSADATTKTMNMKATQDEVMQVDNAKQTQAESDILVTSDLKQEPARPENRGILPEKCDTKAKKDVGEGKKKKKQNKKQGDDKIVEKKKKIANLDPIPVELNIAELAVNDVEVPVERADIVTVKDYPVTPSKGRIDDYGQLTKLLRTPVKVSTPMPDYAIREEEGLANFPDPVDDTEFKMDCNVLRNAFEEGVVDKVDTCIAERMFYRYMPFLQAIQNNTIFSMRQEEYCRNFQRGLNMDFAPGCIIISDKNLQKLMKLMGKNFAIDDEDNLDKVQYFMLVLIPELITKIVMGVYQVNKREAIKMKKEIAIKVTELMGDAIFPY